MEEESIRDRVRENIRRRVIGGMWNGAGEKIGVGGEMMVVEEDAGKLGRDERSREGKDGERRRGGGKGREGKENMRLGREGNGRGNTMSVHLIYNMNNIDDG